MSRSTPALPGTTVYHVGFTVQVVSWSENRNGVSAAPGPVVPANESLRTSSWSAIIVFHRAFSVSVNGSAPIMWKTTGIVTLPFASVGRSLSTPYAFAWFFA